MNITDEKLREGYWYVLQNPCGFLSDLDKIHPDLADNLARVGIIGCGMNSHAEPRYHLTDDGQEHAEVAYNTITAIIIRKYLDYPELFSVA